MANTLFFQDSFLISGIMCFQGCGQSIHRGLIEVLEREQKAHRIPLTSRLIMDAEPQHLGVHRIFIRLECEESEFEQITTEHALSTAFKEGIIELGFDVMDGTANTHKETLEKTNWTNILVNIAAIIGILGISFFVPASLPVTVGLTLLTCITTAFTARDYLAAFFRNVRDNRLANMATTVSLGWLLSLAHTLYHAISMPLMHSFSMTCMNFIMPIVLMLLINGMDEIKRKVINSSKRMHLKSMKILFPEMAEKYECSYLTKEEQAQLDSLALNGDEAEKNSKVEPVFINQLMQSKRFVLESKNTLRQGMIIQVQRGDCFPVDCMLLDGSTLVDASLLTGESQQSKRLLDCIPAGAVNIGQLVKVYTLHDSYNSTVNQILFRSHRAKEETQPVASNAWFTYLYTALVVAGIAGAIILPWAYGVLTIPLLLQNTAGILFGVCPCTIAIAQELPYLLSMYQRGKKGIILRDAELIRQFDTIHTVVFDKTGTLTTGNSQVESFEGISPYLWERIYLLEQHYGAEHPLAKAISAYYERTFVSQNVIQDISQISTDAKGRGLSAVVQGKHLQVGNADYLRQSGIVVPILNAYKLRQGFTPVYVAESGRYQGVIYVKHEIRKDVLRVLSQLKREGKKILMLTGDSYLSARGFNQQNGGVFDEESIYAEQTPEGKEIFMRKLMTSPKSNPQGVWFVGDGLNDAPCARLVTEEGGVSCSMTSDAKVAYFSDISLNGSLDYLLEHSTLNQGSKKNVLQNQFLLVYSALVFLAFIISFSMVGIGVPPIISLVIMASTTLLVLFSAYRSQFIVDKALTQNTSWINQLLASDVPLGLLVGSSLLFTCSLIISTVFTGGLALPVVSFTSGLIIGISSSCLLAAGALLGSFVLVAAAYSFSAQDISNFSEEYVNPERSKMSLGRTVFAKTSELKREPSTSDYWAKAQSTASETKRGEALEKGLTPYPPGVPVVVSGLN
ncbi:MAG: HAD-IC family P-type ATPase [Legionellales bacterium]